MGEGSVSHQPDDSTTPHGDQPMRRDDRIPASLASGGDAASGHPTRTRRMPDVLDQAEQPFVVQAGSTLFMFAIDDSQWTLAELVFDAPSCTFVEAHRAHYGWPREAFGAMLSRVTVGGGMDPERIDRLTDDFREWLAQQFARRP